MFTTINGRLVYVAATDRALTGRELDWLLDEARAKLKAQLQPRIAPMPFLRTSAASQERHAADKHARQSFDIWRKGSQLDDALSTSLCRFECSDPGATSW